MHFTEIFIRRPVLSTVVGAFILLLGIYGIVNLSLRQYPEVEETVVTVTTTYPGAPADLIQGFITEPITTAVATTENLDYITSQSTPSASVVSVHMKLGSDPDAALTEVLSKVQEVRGTLPDESDDPVIVKGTGMSIAMMYLVALNPNMSAEQLTEYITRVIRPRFSTISGIAETEVLGAANYAMRIWLDPLQMAARNVTASEVRNAIAQSNFLAAPGSTENEFFAYTITMQSTLQTPEAFGALPIRGEGDAVVRLRDVAHVELASENRKEIVTFNGQPGTFIALFPTPSANPLNTADAVLRELPAINQSLPEGMEIKLVYNSTETISASIEEVFKTIGEAVAIVVVVILLFLGSFRSVLMPIVTIPLSLIGVCGLMLAMGYSLNLLTLLAMVLAIGLVVDDAIVVVENIHRHMEEGLTPIDAAIVGMREITGPVIAMTITLAAVLAPLGFTGGLTGALFQEFAFTLAGAVIISGIVALLITPMMSARILKHGSTSRFQRFVDGTFDRLANWYERRVFELARLSPRHTPRRRRADGRHGLRVRQHHDGTRARGRRRRAFCLPERATVRDQGIYRALHRPDLGADVRDPGGRRGILDCGVCRTAELGHLHLGLQAVVGAGTHAEGSSAGVAGGPGQGRGPGGLRLRTALAARCR